MGKKHLKPEYRSVIIHLHFKQGKAKTEIYAETGYGEKAVRITSRNHNDSSILGSNASHQFRTKKLNGENINFETIYLAQSHS